MAYERRRADIDFLRAVAVLGVVIYHTKILGSDWGGFAGVDVFFTISGYLITRSILQENNFSFADFYYRRIKRIFPAYIFVMSATVVVSAFIIPPTNFNDYLHTAIASGFFISNIQLFKSVNYFSTGADWNPYTHTWSLAVEEQFYVIWPIAIVLMQRFFSRRTTILVGCLIVASLLCSEYLIYYNPVGAFYLPMSRGFELLIGAFVATSSARVVTVTIPVWLAEILCNTGLAMIAMSYIAIGETTSFPGMWALLPCLGTALVIASGASARYTRRLLSFGPIQLVGRTSYSIYLVHWPLFVLVRYVLNRDFSTSEAIGITLATIALGYVSWRFIEEPFRKLDSVKFSVRWVLQRGTATMAGFLALTSFVALFHISPWSNYTDPVAVVGVADAKTAFQNAPCFANENHAILSVDPYCMAADVGNAPIAVLWGDSHAAHLAPAFRDWARSKGMLVDQFTRPGCGPFADVLILAANADHRTCRDFNKLAYQEILDNPRVKVVVLAAQWWSHLNGYDRVSPGGWPISRSQARLNFVSVLRSELEGLSADGRKVIIVGQVPTLPFDLGECLRRSGFLGSSYDACNSYSSAEKWSIERRTNEYIDRAIFGNRDIALISTTGLFCDHLVCETSSQGKYLYVDENHLAPRGAKLIFDLLPFQSVTFKN